MMDGVGSQSINLFHVLYPHDMIQHSGSVSVSYFKVKLLEQIKQIATAAADNI